MSRGSVMSGPVSRFRQIQPPRLTKLKGFRVTTSSIQMRDTQGINLPTILCRNSRSYARILFLLYFEIL